jgi:hypothetical protein
VISSDQKARRGRWVFVEGKTARCRDCGRELEHGWNYFVRRWSYFVGSTIKLSLCTACVAQHIGRD